MVSPLAVPFDPDMTEEERLAQQEENNRKAAEFSKEFYSRLRVPMSTGSGFRGFPPVTGRPVYQDSTPGFRPTSMIEDLPLITSGPQVTDYTDLSNYTPTYEELPVYSPTTNTYVPDHGGRDDEPYEPNNYVDIGIGSEWTDPSDYEGVTQSPGDDKDPGGGYNSATDNDMSGSPHDNTGSHPGWRFNGGMIPPVYAANGSPAQTAEERRKEEAVARGFDPVRDLVNFGKGMYNTVFEPVVDYMVDSAKTAWDNPIETLIGAAAASVVGPGGKTVTDRFTNAVISNQIQSKLIEDKEGRNSNVTSSNSAFDPSPGTINPDTGEPRRPEDDTIPGGTIPDVNISLTKSGGADVPTVLPKSYIDVYNSSKIKAGPQVTYTNFDLIKEYKEEFAAAQKAKEQAAIDAANAAVAASMPGGYTGDSPDGYNADLAIHGGHIGKESNSTPGGWGGAGFGGGTGNPADHDAYNNMSSGGPVYAHAGFGPDPEKDPNILGETKLNNDNYLAFPQKPSVDPIPRTIFDHPAFVDESRRPPPTDFDFGPFKPQTPVVDPPGELKYFPSHPAFVDESGRRPPTQNNNSYRPGGK